MNCLICKSSNVSFVQKFKPYLDYESSLYDCSDCGCRFTQHNESAHEIMHSNSTTYSSHSLVQNAIKKQFALGRIENIKDLLSERKANNFIISTIDKILDTYNRKGEILEIGCSQGYLTSYFILKGCNIKGIDISITAINKANSTFGEHFNLIDDKSIMADAPYDVIYHVGTIGCVSDPVGLTKSWLNLLKPGGALIFNAPNKGIVDNSDRVWVSTPPPDLVTIFPPKFWKEQFSDNYDVTVELKRSSLLASGYMHLHSKSEGIAESNIISDKHKKNKSVFIRIYLRIRALYYGLFKERLDEEYGVNVIIKKKINDNS